MSTDIKQLSRQDEIQHALAERGLRMEHSLDALDGIGHAIISIATGEQAEDGDLSADVLALAEEWTVLEGPVVGEEAEAIADRIVSRVLPPVPDRLTFQVWHDGDRSVGLPGERSVVQIDMRSYAESDRRDYAEQVRESLKASFGALWDTRPNVMTEGEIRAQDAALDGGAKTWVQGDTAKFGKDNSRDVEVFAGLFRYSGFGMGNYYSAAQSVEWIDTSEAQRRAKEEGVGFVYWDAEQAFDPAGYERHARDKYIAQDRQASGFVLAFPGESQAVCDELVETLGRGGNTVYRVDEETAERVLRAVAASAGLEADGSQP